MFRSTVLLCALAVQVLSAPSPNGCTEACTSYHSHRTAESLVQQEAEALNRLRQLPLDYTRPGNWTEHNEYRTDGGAGRVYEEKGQLVTGPRRVQYYKKNYSSSSHSVSPDEALSPNYADARSILESQSRIGSTSGLESVGHRSSYDEERHRRVHQSTINADGRSGRLEDFGEGVDDSQVLQRGDSATSPNGGNWHTSDTWRTDGGRGVVHEEQGQVVDGSKQIKYYRKNYTSSYSSGDIGGVSPSLVQPNLEAEIQRLQQQFDSFGREIHRSTVGQSSLDVGQVADRTAERTGYVDESHLAASSVHQQQLPATSYESTHDQHRSTIRHGVVARPSSRNYQRTTETQYHETGTQEADYRSSQHPQVEDHRAGYTSQQLYVIPARPLETVQSSEVHQVQNAQVEDHRAGRTSQQSYVIPARPLKTVQRSEAHQVQNSQVEDHRAGRTSQQLYVIPARPLETVQSSEAHQVYQETVAPRRPVVHSVVSEHSVDRANDHLVRVPIHTSADYRSFHSDGRDYGNSQMTGAQIQQTLEDMRRASLQRQSVVSQHGVDRHAGYTDDNAEILSVAGQPGSIKRVEEHWSASGHRSESTIPQPITGSRLVHGHHANYVRSGQSGGQLGSHNSLNMEDVHRRRVSGSSFDRGFESSTGEFTSSALTSGQVLQQPYDCTQEYGGVRQTKFKRDTGRGHRHRDNGDYQQSQDLTQQTEDLTQQSSGFGDYTQQSSGNLEFGQHQHDHSGKLNYGQETQQTEDLTQQTSGFGDYTQQQSGKLEFGQHSQQPEDLTQQTSGFGDYTQQQLGKLELGQHSQRPEDLTQQAGGFGDYTQQQSGKLEFGQQSQQPEDLTQQASGFGDYTQQQSGELEFGQHSQRPEDLTQQTSGFGDYTQQQSGKLEFGQQSQQPEDLTQQTSGFGDYTQQQSGKLEFGQHSQQPEDLTQQTSGFGDYTQQQSGKLEFGQHSQRPEDLTQQTSSFDVNTQQPAANLQSGLQKQQPGTLDFDLQKPGSWSDAHIAVGHQRTDNATQQTEDLTQQTEDLTQKTENLTQQTENLSQQTSGFGDYNPHTSGPRVVGKRDEQHNGQLEFGQQSQQPEDLTQQTSGFGDYTQQQSGKLEFGQHSQRPEDLTQQTSGFGDYTQHPSGKLEFGQQNQHPEDLTQQTSGFGDYTQQQSGKLEFGQHSQRPEDLTQTTSEFGDYMQESGKLEFGQHSQHPEDLTQQTSEFGDYTQQQSGKLEFGQHSQHPDDLTQQTSGFGDYTQQQSGRLEFGQHSQRPEDLTQTTSGFGDYTQQLGKLEFGQHSQQPDDLTQQTSGFGDYTQQSGKSEFGQHSQHHDDLTHQTSGFGDYTQQSGKLEFGHHSQHPDDLTQQTSGFGDYTQQTGKLEFGQHSQHPDDLTQQTSGFGDYTQQSGKLEFGQHTQQPDDLTQQTSGFGDYIHQTSGNLQFGQQHEQQTGKLEFGQQVQHPFKHENEDLSQQTQQSGFSDYTQQTSGDLQFGQEPQQPGTIEFGQESTTANPRKSENPGVKGGRPRRPAPKPTLKHRQRRPHSGTEVGDTVIPSISNSPFDVQPELDLDSAYRPMNTGNARQENLPSVQSLEEQEAAQNRASPLTNDPSAQWHMTHHPGDLTNSENLETQRTSHGVDELYQKKSYKSRDNSAIPETRHSRQDSSVQTEKSSEPKLEPRIIEAYGGNGAYDVEHNEDIFGNAKVNPSATLPPNPSEDPWYIREKPAERPVERPIERPVERPVEELDPSRITFPTDPPEVPTTPPPSFWGRIGHKLTTTYEKAKEKATSIFGK